MAKIWCDESDCWYNRKYTCKSRDVMVYEGECISCRYEKPEKGRVSRDPEDVRRDRKAKQVAGKIMDDLLERMNAALHGGAKQDRQNTAETRRDV